MIANHRVYSSRLAIIPNALYSRAHIPHGMMTAEPSSAFSLMYFSMGPLKKIRTEGTSKAVRAKGWRFKAPHSPTTMAKICWEYVPQNTAKSTTWALQVFQAWRDQHNKNVAEQCPENLLEAPTVDRLNYWLSRFVVEAHRKDGKPYPPGSINNILARLCHYSVLCSQWRRMSEFYEQKRPCFL